LSVGSWRRAIQSQNEIGSVQREDGTVIAYDVAGTGPPVVFLHGLTSNRRRWTPVTELLVESFTCVRIDARGHGESSKAGDYGVLTMAADVGAVVGELGIEAPAVVGHSLGGSMAAIFALIQPARAELYAAVESADRDMVLGVWAQLFSSTDEELNAAMAAALSRLQARCLSLHGSQPGEGYAEWLTGHVPHAEVEVWEGMGHFLHLVDPARFAERVRDFVA
jgi:pimeloyl-ACP methyl ester carboxylesterase